MERITTISATRVSIFEKVLNALGKEYDISTICKYIYDDDNVDPKGRGVMHFGVICPALYIQNPENDRFANRLSTISYYCKSFNRLNLEVVAGKDPIINTKELKEYQIDHIYHLMQCRKADCQTFCELSDFARGVCHWEDDRKIWDIR